MMSSYAYVSVPLHVYMRIMVRVNTYIILSICVCLFRAQYLSDSYVALMLHIALHICRVTLP